MALHLYVVVMESDRSCVVTASSNPLHIMRSSTTNNLNCGTKSQPWIIEAPIGQQINVSLLQFGSDKTLLKSERHNSCDRYGTVWEKSIGKNVSICVRNEDRQTMVYKSHSNVIEVVFDTMNNDESGLERARIFLGFHGNT